MSAATRVAESSMPSPATVEVVGERVHIRGPSRCGGTCTGALTAPVIYEMKDCSVGIFDAGGPPARPSSRPPLLPG